MNYNYYDRCDEHQHIAFVSESEAKKYVEKQGQPTMFEGYIDTTYSYEEIDLIGELK